MPKSTKAAPPQQASLQELWGKKKAVKTNIEPKAEPKVESEAMDIDLLQEQTGMMNAIRMLRVLSSVGQLRLPNARNQPPQAVRCFQLINSAPLALRCVASPKVKRRRILDSDDETESNTLPIQPCMSDY
jgi:hypothetical protein